MGLAGTSGIAGSAGGRVQGVQSAGIAGSAGGRVQGVQSAGCRECRRQGAGSAGGRVQGAGGRPSISREQTKKAP